MATMKKIVPIVEGPGDVGGLQILLERLLREEFHARDWQVVTPIQTGGCGNMLRENGIEKYVKRAQMVEDCRGILILIDGDAMNQIPEKRRSHANCMVGFAFWLSGRLLRIRPARSVGVVIARWEFEAWFLASIETIAQQGILGLAPGLHFTGDVENHPNPKGWINDHLPGRARYSEVRDQAIFARHIDLQLVSRRSRSFRRLKHAIEQIITNQSQSIFISPGVQRDL